MLQPHRIFSPGCGMPAWAERMHTAESSSEEVWNEKDRTTTTTKDDLRMVRIQNRISSD